MTSHSVDHLRSSPISEVVLLGRRGAAQAKFSPSEIKELAEIEGVRLQAAAESRNVDPLSEDWLANQDDRKFRKNADFISDLPYPDGSSGREVTLSFLTSPVEILGDSDGRVCGVRVCRNRLEASADGPPRPVGTDETWEIECQAVFRSVGYRGVALQGVPFDDRRAIIPNDDGRVLEEDGGAVVSGLYTAGWIKRGPSGLIGTNKADAKETVACLLSDLIGRAVEADPTWDERSAGFLTDRVPNLFSASDWRALDSSEVAVGQSRGKSREKAVSVDQMLSSRTAGFEEV
jgi:ferredoxin--NADP+ reductase